VLAVFRQENPLISLPAVAVPAGLSATRLNLMRGGYLLMGVGLAIVKWPLLPSAHVLPLYEGVTLCLLTAMSLLAFVGLRYPVKLLPLLLFESAWKLLWFAVVALPRTVTGDLDPATLGKVLLVQVDSLGVDFQLGTQMIAERVPS